MPSMMQLLGNMNKLSKSMHPRLPNGGPEMHGSQVKAMPAILHCWFLRPLQWNLLPWHHPFKRAVSFEVQSGHKVLRLAPSNFARHNLGADS